MKKTIFITFAAIAALASCSKEVSNIDPQQPAGQTISINVNTEATKAIFGPDHRTVTWENTDQLSVVLMKEDGTFSMNTLFEKGSAKDEFTGTFAETEGPAESGVNTYYALYPYDKKIHSLMDDGKRLVFTRDETHNYHLFIDPGNQNGIDNMDHIHVPMIGKGTAKGLESPDVQMKHAAAIFKVKVTNPGTTSINVKSIKLSVDGTEKMSGGFRVNPDGDYTLLADSDGNNYAEMTVTNGTVAAGQTAAFYIMTSRVRLNADSGCTKFTIEVKTDKDFMVLEKPVDTANNPLLFKEGQVHETSLDYVKTGDLQIASLDITTTPEVDFTKMEEGALPEYFLEKGQSSIAAGLGLCIPKVSSCLMMTSVPVGRLVIAQDKTSAIKVEASADNVTFDVILEAGKPASDATVPIVHTIENLDNKDYQYFKITAGKASKPLYIQKMTFTPAKK